MKVLVANLGSTSFKYRLLDMSTERQLAVGGIERIGEAESRAVVEIDGQQRELALQVPDHAAAVELCLAQLTDPDQGCLADASEVAAIGFKAVHGGRTSGVKRVDEELLSAMEEMSQIHFISKGFPGGRDELLARAPYRRARCIRTRGGQPPCASALHPSCSVAMTCGSSPATWVGVAVCVPSGTERAWLPRWG